VPRVCTEFFSSAAVFSGVVVSERDCYPPDSDLDERTYYKLKVETVYRGRLQEFIEVYTEINSARATLEVGHEYLLFASLSAGQLQFWCGKFGRTQGRKQNDPRDLAAHSGNAVRARRGYWGFGSILLR